MEQKHSLLIFMNVLVFMDKLKILSILIVKLQILKSVLFQIIFNIFSSKDKKKATICQLTITTIKTIRKFKTKKRLSINKNR